MGLSFRLLFQDLHWQVSIVAGRLLCAWKNFIVGSKTAWDHELSSGWMMSGQLNSFFCGFYPRWFEEDLRSEVVFWSVAHVHVHSHLPIPLRPMGF